MKAIICPQCGGLIDKVTEGRRLAQCGYCGAKVLIEPDQRPEPKPAPRDTLHVPLENYRPFDEDPVFTARDEQHSWEDYNPNATLNKAVGIAVGAVILVFFFVIFVFVSSSKKPPETFQPSALPRKSPAPAAFSMPTVPTVSNEDAIKFPNPIVPKGVKIREETEVQVYVTVDEKGNVTDAQAYGGPDALNKAAVQAAKKAKFHARDDGKLSTGLLTYDFDPR